MSGGVKANLHAAMAELKARSEDALSLFRAMPSQVDFIKSRAAERLMRGGNRSGKSTICAVETASAAMRRPIIGPDGVALPFHYPTDKPLMIWVIGLGEDHIGDTLYRLLFEPGLFSIIEDLETGKMRAYNPSDPADAARESEKKPAPPLIPARYIADTAWKDKKAKVFSRVELTNGNVVRAFTSKGDVKQGDPVDLVWIDEDIEDPNDINEYLARISDRKGRLIWSSWPRIANPALYSMSKRADEQRNSPDPDVASWRLTFSANPFIDAKTKKQRIDAWGPEESRARDQGEFVLDTILMYPEFDILRHCSPPHAQEQWDKIDEELAKNQFIPPRDWTRRLILDPGHGTTALMFLATTPPELGDYVVMYDELYLHQCTPEGCAKRAKAVIAGYRFHSYMIDYRYGHQHHVGAAIGQQARTVRECYADAFAAEGLTSQTTGSSFLFSSDDVPAGITAFRSWLVPRANGRSRFRVIKHKCPEFLNEIQLYRKLLVKTEASDKPAGGQKDHQMDCGRYAALDGCPYVAVPDDGLGGIDPGPHWKAWQQFNAMGQRPTPNQSSSFGPGRAA